MSVVCGQQQACELSWIYCESHSFSAILLVSWPHKLTSWVVGTACGNLALFPLCKCAGLWDNGNWVAYKTTDYLHDIWDDYGSSIFLWASPLQDVGAMERGTKCVLQPKSNLQWEGEIENFVFIPHFISFLLLFLHTSLHTCSIMRNLKWNRKIGRRSMILPFTLKAFQRVHSLNHTSYLTICFDNSQLIPYLLHLRPWAYTGIYL